LQAITFIRLNSQRLPNKSILPIGGIPLYEYSMNTMAKVKGIDEILVNSSEDYLKRSDVNYRFIKRPKSLDGDVDFNELMANAIPHIDSEYILFFCVTSPFLKQETIEDMIDAVQNRGYDSALPVVSIKNFCWYKQKPLNYDLSKNIPWTQHLEPVYVESSGFYIFKKSLFEETGRRIGFNPYLKEVDPFEGHDIDYEHDLHLAKSFLEANLV
jgi:CMP-N-acetylneuraminic acid synthetase|tara:strand:- start:94 stop:732 length:639 start_codon:yes stop_codon:yes gene_type:complete